MLDLIKAYEGLLLEARKCPAGVWTIGWGHTAGVTPGMKITVAEAERLLQNDVDEVAGYLDAMTAKACITLRANQRKALVSFIFNVGIGNFRSSRLWRRIAANPDDPRIADEFMRWTKGGGRVLPGLVNRRTHEAALYMAR